MLQGPDKSNPLNASLFFMNIAVVIAERFPVSIPLDALSNLSNYKRPGGNDYYLFPNYSSFSVIAVTATVLCCFLGVWPTVSPLKSSSTFSRLTWKH